MRFLELFRIRTSRGSGQIFAVLLAIAFVFCELASGATFTVTKIADTDDGVCDTHCSLREAVAAANANSLDDVIGFDPTLFATPQNIVLNGTQIVLNSNGALTVNGPGASLLEITNNFMDRIFRIDSGAVVTINNLKLSAGDALDGGAIYNSGTLTVFNCVVDDNSALQTGGGIYNDQGTLRLIDSDVSNNSTYDSSGGGIYSLSGTIELIRTSVSNNSAGALGGGVKLTSSQGLISASTIDNNTAADGGGGIAGDGGSSATIINSTIGQNTNSGILNLPTSSLNLISSTIAENNSNTTGGGISNLGIVTSKIR